LAGAAHDVSRLLAQLRFEILEARAQRAGVDLRPNSIATCGGWPRRKPMMQVLMVV
jgi:hypothetical protein